MIPNTVILAPASFEELRQCLKRAIFDLDGIACVRYPKGGESTVKVGGAVGAALSPARDFAYSGKHGTMLAVTYGRISAELAAACEEIGADFLRLVRISPLPESAVDIACGYDRVVFFEEGILNGSASEGMRAALSGRGFRGGFAAVGADDRFVPAATVEEQLEMFGLDRESMKNRLKQSMKG
jgi:1-deoxy-D-xylulose-5-phosphate synthase